jgi:hypothetical protein
VLHFEEINFQGAYIRVLILMTLESLITKLNSEISNSELWKKEKNVSLIKASFGPSIQILNSIEVMIRTLLAESKIDDDVKGPLQYSKAHTKLVRMWQMLCVLQGVLNPGKLKAQVSFLIDNSCYESNL